MLIFNCSTPHFAILSLFCLFPTREGWGFSAFPAPAPLLLTFKGRNEVSIEGIFSGVKNSNHVPSQPIFQTLSVSGMMPISLLIVPPPIEFSHTTLWTGVRFALVSTLGLCYTRQGGMAVIFDSSCHLGRGKGGETEDWGAWKWGGECEREFVDLMGKGSRL